MAYWTDCAICSRHHKSEDGDDICPQCKRGLSTSCPYCASLRSALAKAEGELSALLEKINVEGLEKFMTGRFYGRLTEIISPGLHRSASVTDIARALVAHLEG